MDLEGKVAVVTGASSGVGRAIALSLAREAATVCLTGRDGQRLAGVAEDVRKAGGRVLAYLADLSEDGEIEELRAQVERDCGFADVLVHSAAVIALGPAESASVDDLDRQYRTNLRAPYLLNQAMLPMLKERRGQVVFINSSAGLKAKSCTGSYAASKHGLRAIADSLRDEVNAHGIRVLSVFLSQTATPMQAAIYQREGKAYEPERLLQPEDVAEIVVSAIGLPRTAEVTDISLRPAMNPSV